MVDMHLVFDENPQGKKANNNQILFSFQQEKKYVSSKLGKLFL